MFLTVRIIPPIEAGAQLRVAEDFVRLVDLGHFLLGLFFRDALGDGFVRVELFGEGAVLAFDGAIVGVVGDVEHLVVVFGFGSFELHLSFLEELADSVGGGVMFMCFVEGLDACFVLPGVELALSEGEEGGERVRF